MHMSADTSRKPGTRGRPPAQDGEKRRRVFFLSDASSDLVAWVALTYSMSVSGALNYVLTLVSHGDRAALDSLSRSYNSRRQF